MVVVAVVVAGHCAMSMKATVTTMVLAGRTLPLGMHRKDGPGLPVGAVPVHPDGQPEHLQPLADPAQRLPISEAAVTSTAAGAVVTLAA